MVLSNWRIDLHDLNTGSARVTGVHFKSMKFSYVLNGPGTFEADLVLTHPDTTRANWKPGATEVRIYRDNTRVWGGYLWGRSIEMRDTASVRGEGHASILRHRLITDDKIYDDVLQEDIAWDLINYTQNTHGPLGISRGSHTGDNVKRDRDYCGPEHADIFSGIDELTNPYDGLDWEITPTPHIDTNKEFRTFSSRKGNDQTADVGFNDYNLMRLSFEENADDMATRVLTTGTDDCNPPDDDRESASTSEFGVLMVAQSVDADNRQDVVGYAQERLRHGRYPQWSTVIQYMENPDDPACDWGAFVVGDVINVTNARGDPFDKDFRVLSHSVNIDASGHVFYEAELDGTTTGDIS